MPVDDTFLRLYVCSSIVAMETLAQIIENSAAVVLCISDAFKRDTYCQTAVRYAFDNGRQIFPLILRKGSKADGWISSLVSSHISSNLGTSDFKSVMESFVKQIHQRRNNNTAISKPNVSLSASTAQESYTLNDIPDMPSPSIESVSPLKLLHSKSAASPINEDKLTEQQAISIQAGSRVATSVDQTLDTKVTGHIEDSIRSDIQSSLPDQTYSNTSIIADQQQQTISDASTSRLTSNRINSADDRTHTGRQPDESLQRSALQSATSTRITTETSSMASKEQRQAVVGVMSSSDTASTLPIVRTETPILAVNSASRPTVTARSTADSRPLLEQQAQVISNPVMATSDTNSSRVNRNDRVEQDKIIPRQTVSEMPSSDTVAEKASVMKDPQQPINYTDTIAMQAKSTMDSTAALTLSKTDLSVFRSSTSSSISSNSIITDDEHDLTLNKPIQPSKTSKTDTTRGPTNQNQEKQNILAQRNAPNSIRESNAANAPLVNNNQQRVSTDSAPRIATEDSSRTSNRLPVDGRQAAPHVKTGKAIFYHYTNQLSLYLLSRRLNKESDKRQLQRTGQYRNRLQTRFPS
jgi:hypothetical protein